MFNRKELKSQARKQLVGEYPPAVFVSMMAFFLLATVLLETGVPFTLYGFLSSVLNPFFYPHEWLTSILLPFFLLLFIGGPIIVGKCHYFLNAIKKQWKLADLFFPFFSKTYFNIVFVMLVYLLIVLSIFAIFFSIIFFPMVNNLEGVLAFSFIFSALFIYPSHLIFYRFRFVPYILAENPNMKLKEVFHKSGNLAHQIRGQLFLYDLSFAGWYVIGSLGFGVGMFLVMPYHEAAVAQLFLKLKEQENEKKQNREGNYRLIEMWGEKEEDVEVSGEVNVIKSSRMQIPQKGLVSLLILLLVLVTNNSIARVEAANIQNNPFYSNVNVTEEVEYVDENIYLDQPIVVTHDLKISGSGTIFVTGAFHHFVVMSGATLTIEGDVVLDGTRLFEPSEIDQESEPQGIGGILVYGGTLKLMGGELRSISPSHTYNSSGDRVYFGAINVEEGGLFHMYGGLVNRSTKNGVRLTGDSVFRMYGGTISNSQMTGVVVAGGSEFFLHDGQIADNNNGGVTITGASNMHMHGGTIIGNSRETTSMSSRNDGGGVRVSEGIFNLYDGLITENAASRGGGVFVSTSGVFNMQGGTIDTNEGVGGGGIFLFQGIVNIYDGVISNNTASNGGGIYQDRGSMNIYGGIIKENNARSLGGGINVNSGNFMMIDGIIAENHAGSGGGISILFDGEALILGGQIKENHAETGGGIHFFAFGPTAIVGGEIINNHANNGGGIQVTFLDMLAVGEEVVFSGNTADGRSYFSLGGRLQYPQIRWFGENSVPGSHVINNYDISYVDRSSWSPGALLYHLIFAIFAGIVMISSNLASRFKKRKVIVPLIFLLFLILIPAKEVVAQEEIIVTDEATLREAVTIPDSRIIVNQDIHIEDEILISENVTITGNGTITVSDHHRHFVIRSEGTLTLEDEITLTRKEGYTGFGGGISVDRDGILYMSGGLIIGNSNRGRHCGGGVTVRGSFYMSGGVISENSADIGGGVLVQLFSAFTMTGGEIINNHSTGHGGGVGIYTPVPGGARSFMNMYGGTISGNTAGFINFGQGDTVL